MIWELIISSAKGGGDKRLKSKHFKDVFSSTYRFILQVKSQRYVSLSCITGVFKLFLNYNIIKLSSKLTKIAVSFVAPPKRSSDNIIDSTSKAHLIH